MPVCTKILGSAGSTQSIEPRNAASPQVPSIPASTLHTEPRNTASTRQYPQYIKTPNYCEYTEVPAIYRSCISKTLYVTSRYCEHLCNIRNRVDMRYTARLAIASTAACLRQISHSNTVCLTYCWAYFCSQELLDYFEAEVDAKGLDALMPGGFVANYARPRRFEVRAQTF